MARVVILYSYPTTPVPVDGWCPACLLPSLVTFDLVTLSEHGVSTLGTWTGCGDCRTPLKP